MAWATSPCSSNRSARELSTLALAVGLFWKSWRQSSSSALASPKRPSFPSTLARFIRVAAMSSAGRSNARLTSSMASIRRRADSQSCWAKSASVAMSSAPMNVRARNSASGASGTGWPERCRCHQASTCASRASTSGNAASTWPCMMSMRRASSSLPMTLIGWAARLLVRLGGFKVPLARGVQVAGHHRERSPSCR